MGELRKDYILDRWVVISTARGKRPHEIPPEPEPKLTHACFFCPGNENLTTKEIGRIPENHGWKVRWFSNKFPAESPEGKWQPVTHNRFFTFSDSYGYHEIIVETPFHNKQFAQLSENYIEQVLYVYARRIVSLEKLPHIIYVNVFKNHGAAAGTSIIHSHSQIIAESIMPPNIKEKIAAIRKFIQCPYCQIIEAERMSDRKCFENDDFIAFTPYASRFNYEIWIFPKVHISRMESVNLHSMAKILSKVLKKINKAGFAYNLLVQYGPAGEDFHFHIEICPRIATWAGFEFNSGIIINSVSPEDAAKFYRGEL